MHFSTYWNKSNPTRNNTTIRNNILVDSGTNASGAFSRHQGIRIESTSEVGGIDAFTNVKVQNNTVYKVGNGGVSGEGYGIIINVGPAIVQNNIVYDTAAVCLLAASGVLSTHSNNLFFKSGTDPNTGETVNILGTPASCITINANYWRLIGLRFTQIVESSIVVAANRHHIYIEDTISADVGTGNVWGSGGVSHPPDAATTNNISSLTLDGKQRLPVVVFPAAPLLDKVAGSLTRGSICS